MSSSYSSTRILLIGFTLYYEMLEFFHVLCISLKQVVASLAASMSAINCLKRLVTKVILYHTLCWVATVLDRRPTAWEHALFVSWQHYCRHYCSYSNSTTHTCTFCTHYISWHCFLSNIRCNYVVNSTEPPDCTCLCCLCRSITQNESDIIKHWEEISVADLHDSLGRLKANKNIDDIKAIAANALQKDTSCQSTQCLLVTQRNKILQKPGTVLSTKM